MMRAPIRWLRDYVDLPESAEALAERLPMLGLGVEEVLGSGDDAVLDLEIAYNRPDLLGLIGIAHEIAAWGRREIRLPDAEPSWSEAAGLPSVPVEIDDPALCPRYIACLITGVTVEASPPAIASRLEAAGIRPINSVVDATNYVMLEWGQPLHAFDWDSLVGGRIVVRLARGDERLVTLDGVERSLDPAVLVIADAARPVALAGIMGGLQTEIRPDTRTVLLEAAAFSPTSVRRSSRRLGLRTDASSRFERGIDPGGVARAAGRAAALIAEICNGTVAGPWADAYPSPVLRRPIAMRLARMARLLGTEIPAEEAVEILSRLGLEARLEGGTVLAVPPVGRRDLEREEDLVEEVARHFGYERIPEAMPMELTSQGRRPHRLEAESAARDALIRLGLVEAVTLSLVGGPLLDRLGLPADDPWRHTVPISNPLTAEHTHLRPALLPGLLDAARLNIARRREAVHFFEIGRIFREGNSGVVERRSLAVVMWGAYLEGFWQGGAPKESALPNLTGVLEGLAEELRAGALVVESGGPAWLHPARAGRIGLDGLDLGVMGELHPAVAARFELPGRAYVAELDLDLLLDRALLQPRFSGLPRHPAVHRDIAIVAPQTLPHAVVRAALQEAAGPLLESADLFDAYTGPPLQPGSRNLAYALSFRAQDRTLTGEEVDGLMAAIYESLPARLSVTIRG